VRYTWRGVRDFLRQTQATLPSNLPPRYNICPTEPIDVVLEHKDARGLMQMRWGLVPAWWTKKANQTPATFNARVGTVATKPMFRDALRQHRCITPASWHYEWKPTLEGKQPYYFAPRGGSPVLAMANVWDKWYDIETGKPLFSCSLIITNANDFVRDIHDRMPALLEPDQFTPWLSGTAYRNSKAATERFLADAAGDSSRAPDDDATLIAALPG
jgi:putative SOS response-associated peptidase YedK